MKLASTLDLQVLVRSARELLALVSRAETADDGAAISKLEIDAPVLERKAHALPVHANAPVRVRVGAEGQRSDDAGLKIVAPFAEPVDLGARQGAELDLPWRQRIVWFEPARACLRVRIGVSHVGLQIQHGRAVEEVHVAHVNEQPVHALDADGAQTEGVRPVGRAGGKDAALRRAARGKDLRPPAAPGVDVLVENEDDPGIVPGFEAFEGVLVAVAGEELDGRSDVGGDDRLTGGAGALRVGGMNDPNRIEDERTHDQSVDERG